MRDGRLRGRGGARARSQRGPMRSRPPPRPGQPAAPGARRPSDDESMTPTTPNSVSILIASPPKMASDRRCQREDGESRDRSEPGRDHRRAGARVGETERLAHRLPALALLVVARGEEHAEFRGDRDHQRAKGRGHRVEIELRALQHEGRPARGQEDGISGTSARRRPFRRPRHIRRRLPSEAAGRRDEPDQEEDEGNGAQPAKVRR